jgi:uncharacterized protein
MQPPDVLPIRPLEDIDSAPFWAALREHRLTAQHCAACGNLQYPPRPACRRCLSFALDQEPLSGRGTLVTYTVTVQSFHRYFDDKIPYVLGVVALPEQDDLRILTRVVDVQEGELHAGLGLTVDFEEVSPELTLPVFRAATIAEVSA